MTPPRCPQHGLELRCPACTGAAGGESRSPAKVAASRVTVAQARAVRAATPAPRCLRAVGSRYCTRPAGHAGPCRGGLTIPPREEETP